MGYEPTVWKTGDVVTSAKLNKLEEGVANAGPFIVHIVEEDPSPEPPKSAEKSGTKGAEYNLWLDRTWQEIFDAFKNGKWVMISAIEGEVRASNGIITEMLADQDGRHVHLLTNSSLTFEMEFTASSSSGYPGTTVT